MSTVSTQVTIPVRVGALDEWTWAITCYLRLKVNGYLAGSTRFLKANEGRVCIQYEWGWAQWTTHEPWCSYTGSNGMALINTKTGDMRFGKDGKYRVWAEHVPSGAVVSREIHLDADGNPTFFAPVDEKTGKRMPSTFAMSVGQTPRTIATSVTITVLREY